MHKIEREWAQLRMISGKMLKISERCLFEKICATSRLRLYQIRLNAQMIIWIFYFHHICFIFCLFNNRKLKRVNFLTSRSRKTNAFGSRLIHFKVGLSPSKKVIFICFNENILKMMKNAFYFMLNTPFILEIYTVLAWIFGYVEKRLHKEAMVNFKIVDVTDWATSNYNTHIAQYLKK